MGDDHDILANVNALMWLVFGLGTGLTLVGLRMITRPAIEFHSAPPMGKIGEVFENPD